MNRRTAFLIIVILLACLCLTAAGTLGLLLQSPDILAALGLGGSTPAVTQLNTPPATGALPPATQAFPVTGPPVLVSPSPATSPPAVSGSTIDALLKAEIPERDMRQIVPRLTKKSSPTAVATPVARPRRVGDKDKFFVFEDTSSGTYRTITATLQAVVPHAYYWVEDGIRVELPQLRRSAEFFENSIYPTNQKYFGQESPGPDGDTHINILNTRFKDAAGYFSSVDTHPRSIAPYSNERNIIYLNVDAITPGTDEYNADTAHEFQHLIFSYQADAKAGWIDEGMAELAMKLNGFDVGGFPQSFARNPNTQLNTWGSEPQVNYAHYGASYLFFNYTANRFGPEFTRAVIHAPRPGIFGIQAALDQRSPRLQFDDLFADWAVANYLNDPTIENGIYAYPNERAFRIVDEPRISRYPVTRSLQMNQYAANYHSLQPAGGEVTIYFTGTTTAQLASSGAHGGTWSWYSNRSDLADMSLTRSFDLSRVAKATLQFWTWFDIEKNYDYGFVEVSTDEGRTWEILKGKYTTSDNPNGANYGHAYTGRSGVTDEQEPAAWVREQMDLTPFAGKKILLRFEYITDDAFNASGWQIDDISIPEINFVDDVESAGGTWDAKGFIRSDNILPQRFIVQVVEQRATRRIIRIPLDAQNRGKISITGFGNEVTGAVLIITAHAPTTTEATKYQFSISPGK